MGRRDAGKTSTLIAIAGPTGIAAFVAALIALSVLALSRTVGRPAAPCTCDGPECHHVLGASATSGGFFANIFDTSDFPARWNCGRWTAGYGWLHVVSDLAIWGAYMAIPITLLILVFKRKDLPFPAAFWLFGAFILACGTLHLLEALIFWWPAYRLSGLMKLGTASVSWATVLVLIPLLPKALAMPGVQRVNDEMRREALERERVEKELADIAAIVESSDDAIFRATPQGAISSWNAGAEHLFGYTRDEIRNETFLGLVPAELRPEAQEILRRVMAGQPVEHFETTRVRKDGTLVDISLSLAPIVNGERLEGISAVARDITNRKETEQALRQANQDLARKSSEMEQFVYSASHDLKSPIVTIQGFVGHLRRDFDAGRVDRLEDFLCRIERASTRIRENIDDLLAFSRIGRVANELATVDVDAVIRQLVAEHEVAAAEQGVTIEVAGPLPTARADRGRLAQVFDNLIVNALKYGCGGEDPCIIIGSVFEGSEVRFFVRDNGPGIDPTYHDRIFQLFQRLEGTADGSGIGLAIVRRIAEVHRGSAWVESTPGEGATFWLSLPVDTGIGRPRSVDAA